MLAAESAAAGTVNAVGTAATGTAVEGTAVTCAATLLVQYLYRPLFIPSSAVVSSRPSTQVQY